MAKAFDRVDHQILLSKLEAIGLSRLAMEWFSSYLTGRLISTKVDQVRSAIRPTFSGVPQGSVLGPLLFLLFNGDLPSAVKCNSALFADDTMVSATGCMPSTQPCCGVSAGVEECHRWASRNNSGFNANKSAELFITFARQKAVSTPLLTLGNATIPVLRARNIWVSSLISTCLGPTM